MKVALRNRLLLIGTAITVLLIDQLTKSWVVHNLPPYTPVNLFPWLKPLLSFTYVKNTGVAFGLFPQLGYVFMVLSALVIIGIFVFQRSVPPNAIWIHVALGLVTGGAVGNNLVDRIARGYVVDFFDANFWPFETWPVFNVADSAIVMGVVILLADSLFVPQDQEEELLADV
jgi:signal peptidase II